MTPATLSAATLLVKARRNSVPSARRIVEVAARRLGLDWRTCSPSDRLRLLHAVRLLSGAWLQRAAEEAKAIIEADGEKALFGRARAAADRFFRRAHKFIGNMVLAGVMAFLGPGAPTTIEAQAINQQTEIQRAYLQRYEQEVMDERKPLDAARAAQYGAAVWTTTHSVVRTIVTAPGSPIVEEYAEHRGVDEPCTGCQARLAQGRVPVGTLAPIGATPCRIFCHCVIIYVDASGTEYFAGRGPLHEPVFGTRGMDAKFNPHQARDSHGRFAASTSMAEGGTLTPETIARRRRHGTGGDHPGVDAARRRKPPKRWERKLRQQYLRKRKRLADTIRRRKTKVRAQIALADAKLAARHEHEWQRQERFHDRLRERVNEHFDHLAESGKYKPRTVERVRREKHERINELEAERRQRMRERHENEGAEHYGTGELIPIRAPGRGIIGHARQYAGRLERQHEANDELLGRAAELRDEHRWDRAELVARLRRQNAGQSETGKSWVGDGASLLKDYHPGQARDAHGRWTSAGGGRYQHNTAITGVGYHADIHRITQEINSSRAGPGHSKRRIWRARVRSRKQGQLRIKVREHRKKIGRKISAQRRRNEARRAREVASETRYHEQDLAKLDREHAQAGTTGSAEHVGRRERLEREHTRLMGVIAQNHRYDRDAERTEYRYEAALARQHHRDTEAIYLRQRHERLTEGD